MSVSVNSEFSEATDMMCVRLAHLATACVAPTPTLSAPSLSKAVFSSETCFCS